ncbi:Ubiquitin domain [Arabidopsis suecica]|uniref:Ubiquitin domain n=1 Tax=Arabidopsis suecica TaxID=45249 RepID=A0A8T1ZIH6_ARASU|nr:Ubiquitin domain [Arabidopsis suecica]
MMNVLIDTESGSTFSINVDFWETVLTIKEKIEKSQGIPVAKQTLYFQGKVLQDHVDKFDCQLLLDSRLLLYISPEDNPNQNNDQMLIDSATGKKITKVVARRIHNEYSSGPAYSLVELLAPQDSPTVTVGNQVVQTTEQSPPSDSAKEKLTVYVKPYEDDPRIIQVEVNADDNAEELRKELVKMQERGELYLPHEGFSLVYSALPLTESESFKWNLVVFFEIQSGSSFEIEVDYKDTVLEMKDKIEKCQRISVSEQTLIFDGNVLQDDLDIEQYKIVHESRLQLFVSPDHNPNQTEQSPPPSSSIEQIIDDGHQDSTVTVQTEQSPSSNPTEKIINAHQDSTVTVQTEQSPSSNSVEEMITNIQDSSEKERIPKKRIVVYVLPYSGESEAIKEIPVAVNVKMNDNVKELRNELVKIEENDEREKNGGSGEIGPAGHSGSGTRLSQAFARPTRITHSLDWAAQKHANTRTDLWTRTIVPPSYCPHSGYKLSSSKQNFRRWFVGNTRGIINGVYVISKVVCCYDGGAVSKLNALRYIGFLSLLG